jgi:hypothetical protein
MAFIAECCAILAEASWLGLHRQRVLHVKWSARGLVPAPSRGPDMRMLKQAVIAGMILVSGSAMAQTFAPPPPPADEIAPPPPPGPAANFYLAPGHYVWAGGRYVWAPRRWIPVRVGYTRWVPEHWAVGRFGRWHLVPGHWAR